ncbi:MAG: hypothetical protein KC475_07570 [Cyanobacteria bacterium HKST-UBA03]|nr:hypothetical protein [Cyanobacteria bacterium HKST-UBA03]
MFDNWLTHRLPSLPKLRLSHQMIGFFVLVVLIPLSLLSFSIYDINQKALKKQIAHFTANSAEATYRELTLKLDWQMRENELAAFFWNKTNIGPGNRINEAVRDDFFEQYPNTLAVGLYTAQGQRIATLYQSTQIQQQLTTELSPDLFPVQMDATALYGLATPNLSAAAKHHNQTLKLGTLVGNPGPDNRTQYVLQTDLSVNALLSQSPVMAPATAVHSSIGVIRLVHRFDFLTELLAEKQKIFGDGLVIFSPQGRILAGPKPWVNRDLPRYDKQVFAELLRDSRDDHILNGGGFPLNYSMNNFQGVEPKRVEKVFYRLPGVPWGMMMESPYKLQQQYIAMARNQTILLLALCGALIIVLGLFYNKGIVRNFRQLMRGIKAVAEGHYSRRIRLITKSWTPHEIIVLTGEFNRMAGKISKAWVDIQQLNRELVHKTEIEEFIAKATQRIHSSLELEQVCQTAARQFCKLPHMVSCQIWLADSQGRLVSQAQTFNAYDNHHPPQGSASDTGRPSASDTQNQLMLELFPSWKTHLVDAAVQHKIEPSLKFVYKRQVPSTFTCHQIDWIPSGLKLMVYPVLYQSHAIGVMAFWMQDSQSTPYQTSLLQDRRPDLMTGLSVGTGKATHHRRDDQLIIDLLTNQVGIAVHQARQWEQLQQANEQLAQLDELKSNLIDTVSHELRTPLTSIKGYTSRLIRYDNTLESDTRIKSLKVVKKQADRLERLVNDLLVIPDLERQGGLRIFTDEVHLNPIIQHLMIFLEERAQRPIEVRMPDIAMHVVADPDRLEQVLLNLLDNALKYGSTDQPITLTITPNPNAEQIQFDIFNHCPPIPPDELNQLFDKFKRLDEKLTRTTRGTGLGLFIAKGLVEAMDGHIWLESPPSGGFKVSFTMPMTAHIPSPPTTTTGIHAQEARL